MDYHWAVNLFLIIYALFRKIKLYRWEFLFSPHTFWYIYIYICLYQNVCGFNPFSHLLTYRIFLYPTKMEPTDLVCEHNYRDRKLGFIKPRFQIGEQQNCAALWNKLNSCLCSPELLNFTSILISKAYAAFQVCGMCRQFLRSCYI